MFRTHSRKPQRTEELEQPGACRKGFDTKWVCNRVDKNQVNGNTFKKKGKGSDPLVGRGIDESDVAAVRSSWDASC